jgi:hypothetical protein
MVEADARQMSEQRVDDSIGRLLRELVPPLLGWQGFRRAFFNLLITGLTVVVATWIVHQTEYLIEYGNRFGTIMATSPHRFYMEPAGIVLLGMGGALASLLSLALHRSEGRIDALVRLLPRRLAGYVHTPATPLPVRLVCRTALVLALAQIVIYLVQENVEWLVAWGYLPGLSVLTAPQHVTVIPLHLLAALCSSALLWVVASRLRQTRRTLHRVRVLSALMERRGQDASHAVLPRIPLRSLEATGGALCPRAPPLAA